MPEHHLKTWAELKAHIAQLKAEAEASYLATLGNNQSPLLFRGQGSEKWKLETTYDRKKPKQRWLEDYYRTVVAAQSMADSLMHSEFTTIDPEKISNALKTKDQFFPTPLPHYDLLVYLRHHGFPSPLLDWSRSFYVAAYFAFEQPQSENVALYVYQEFTGHKKTFSHGDPHLVSFGPWVKTHSRHVLQQAQYTMAVRMESESWLISHHHDDVFSKGHESQDRLTKFIVPSTEAGAVLAELDEMNINAYSLFQTKDALLQTVGSRIFR